VFVLEVHEGAEKGTFHLDPYSRSPDEALLWAQLRRIGLLLDEHMLSFLGVEWASLANEVYLLRVFPVTRVPPYLPVSASDAGAGRGPLEFVRPPGSSARALRPYSWYHRSRSQRLNAAYLRGAHRLFLPYSERDEFYLCGYLYARWRRLVTADVEEDSASGRRLLPSLERLIAARTLDREFRTLWWESRPRLDALNALDLPKLSNQELSRCLEEVMTLSETFYAQRGRLGDSYRIIPDILLRLHRRWLGDNGEVWGLLGTTDDQLRRRDRALCELAQAAYDGDAQREAAFQAFFRRYRHLYLQGDPLAEAQDVCRLMEDEEAARAALRAYQEDEGRAWREQEARRTGSVLGAEQRVLSRLGGIRRAAYRRVLNLARRYAPLRYDRDEPVLLSWLLERDIVLEVGRRLCAEGIAEVPEDATYMGCLECLDCLGGKTPKEELARILKERGELYRRWWRYAPPDVLGDEPRPQQELQLGKSVAAEDVLRGLAVSPGMAEGRARVVNSIGEATNLMPGDVLVCREPLFELSPLFGVASAVVAEAGFLLGHAAVLAREYGVPAVFAAQKATEQIRNGEELQVDGGQGLIIRRHAEPDLEFL
jgi:phosphohistidine swiveling domain-containing protein